MKFTNPDIRKLYFNTTSETLYRLDSVIVDPTGLEEQEFVLLPVGNQPELGPLTINYIDPEFFVEVTGPVAGAAHVNQEMGRLSGLPPGQASPFWKDYVALVEDLLETVRTNADNDIVWPLVKAAVDEWAIQKEMLG